MSGNMTAFNGLLRSCRAAHRHQGQALVPRRYYAFLSALETALPMGKDRGGVQMAFSWGDAFQPRDRPQSTLVAYEKVSDLHASLDRLQVAPVGVPLAGSLHISPACIWSELLDLLSRLLPTGAFAWLEGPPTPQMLCNTHERHDRAFRAAFVCSKLTPPHLTTVYPALCRRPCCSTRQPRRCKPHRPAM